MRVSVRTEPGGAVVGEARGRSVAVQLASQEKNPGLRPTEFLLVGLGACIMGYAYDYSLLKGLPTNLQINLEDRLEAGHSGIAEIAITLDGAVTGDAKAMAELTGIIEQQCKIYNTLSSGVKVKLYPAGHAASIPERERTTGKQAGEPVSGSSCGLRPNPDGEPC